MSALAREALPHTRAKAQRLCLYNTQLPLHNPTESSRKASTTKPSLKTTPPAKAHSASLFSSAMAGLPGLPETMIVLTTFLLWPTSAKQWVQQIGCRMKTEAKHNRERSLDVLQKPSLATTSARSNAPTLKAKKEMTPCLWIQKHLVCKTYSSLPTHHSDHSCFLAPQCELPFYVAKHADGLDHMSWHGNVTSFKGNGLPDIGH